MSNRVRRLVRFVRNKSCGVRKCKNAHLSMRVFRCLCPPRRAACATRPRLSPSASACHAPPAPALSPHVILRSRGTAALLAFPLGGRCRASFYGARRKRGIRLYTCSSPRAPFHKSPKQKPRHSVLRVFLHSHINKTKNAAPCASSSCAHKSPKQNTSPRAPPARPFTAPQNKRRRAVRRADLMPYLAYKISHSETKNVFYFFPFQQ